METESTLNIKGLTGKVNIYFDENRIPHIEAENEEDLYFAQGFMVARDRLWQLDFQTRFAAGRLSEVIGEKAIDLDKYNRRMGMGFGARNMEAFVKKIDKCIRFLTLILPESMPISARLNQKIIR